MRVVLAPQFADDTASYTFFSVSFLGYTWDRTSSKEFFKDATDRLLRLTLASSCSTGGDDGRSGGRCWVLEVKARLSPPWKPEKECKLVVSRMYGRGRKSIYRISPSMSLNSYYRACLVQGSCSIFLS